jgi:N-acetylneuraminic acid mutarotase
MRSFYQDRLGTNIGKALKNETVFSQWEPIAPFLGGGLDCTDYGVVNGELYVFGGWRPRAASMAAWENLFALDAAVPYVKQQGHKT